MKQQFLVDQSGTIRVTVYDKNRALVPSSPLITLYKPDGSVLQAQASASVDSTTGEMTYSLTATHTDDADLNYKAVWEYTENSTTKFQTQLFDVVKSLLSIPITDDDLYNELDSLRKTNKQESGTATDGASGTLVDTNGRKEDDDYWKGGVIETLAGTGANQIRAITGFTRSTSTLSVSPNWTTAPDSTTTYRVIRSYHYKIQECFKKISEMIYNKGDRHQLILESSQIATPLLYLTIHHICLDLMQEEGDKWSLLASTYWDKFNESFNNLKLDYDRDDSGFIQGDEEQTNPTSFTIGRA